MKFTAFSKVILGLLLVSRGGILFASDIDELRERAKAMQTKAALLAEQGNKEEAHEIEKESTKLLEMAERLEAKSNGRPEKEVGFGIDKETTNLKDRLQDLLNNERTMREEQAAESDLLKVRVEIADIERDVHAAKLRLSAETHADSKHNEAGDPDLVAKLKKENERLRAELRELKQNADKRQ